MELAPGQVLYIKNVELNGYHVYLVLARIEEDEDWTDTWGSSGGKSEYGWYWRFLDLTKGTTCIMIDNSITLEDGRWVML